MHRALQSIMQDARRSRRNLSLVWIDLANSIPRHILLDMLERAGLGGRFLDIVKDIYSSSTTKVKTDNTSTPPITMDRGVKQGCPLSPLLFNFVLDGALRRVEELQCGYRIGDHTIKALGYADDICHVTEDKQGLEGMLEALHTFCQWAGLKVKVEKCASLTMVNRGQTEPFSPRIGGQAILPPCHPSIEASSWWRKALTRSFGRARSCRSGRCVCRHIQGNA